MTQLASIHELAWTTRLTEHGYTCLELRPSGFFGPGRRAGWIVNAAVTGWTAHVGAWDGMTVPGGIDPPETLQHFEHDQLAAAQAWVVTELAAWWKDTNRP